MCVRLLGPCFKTGRVETDLLAPQFAQAAHAIDTNEHTIPLRLYKPEDRKAQNGTIPMAPQSTTAHYWQYSFRSCYTDQHARQWHGHKAITPNKATRQCPATFLMTAHYGHSSHLIGRGFSTDRTKCTTIADYMRHIARPEKTDPIASDTNRQS